MVTVSWRTMDGGDRVRLGGEAQIHRP